MTSDDAALAKRVGLCALLVIGLLSIEACQHTGPEPLAETVNTDVSVSLEVKPVQALTIDTEPVLSLRQPSVFDRMNEKHFIIPVVHSGDFAPEALDDYVLRIIDESRQWAHVAELQIHGHTDSEGSELSNMLLSIRRANWVAERFEALGVEAGLLLIEAHGETQGIADNTTLDGRIANRRIEVVLIGNADIADKQSFEAVVVEYQPAGGKP